MITILQIAPDTIRRRQKGIRHPWTRRDQRLLEVSQDKTLPTSVRESAERLRARLRQERQTKAIIGGLRDGVYRVIATYESNDIVGAFRATQHHTWPGYSFCDNPAYGLNVREAALHAVDRGGRPLPVSSTSQGDLFIRGNDVFTVADWPFEPDSERAVIRIGSVDEIVPPALRAQLGSPEPAPTQIAA